MAKVNRRLMILLKILVSLVLSATAVFSLNKSCNVGDIIFWVVVIIFCVGNTVEYARRR